MSYRGRGGGEGVRRGCATMLPHHLYRQKWWQYCMLMRHFSHFAALELQAQRQYQEQYKTRQKKSNATEQSQYDKFQVRAEASLALLALSIFAWPAYCMLDALHHSLCHTGSEVSPGGICITTIALTIPTHSEAPQKRSQDEHKGNLPL